MSLSIRKGSENYCAQVIKLPAKVAVPGLDNLVQVTYQGNQCLIGKDSQEDIPYLFFPSGTVLTGSFLHFNNLFRHSENNVDTTKSGFFDDGGRVKAIKFKGVISTGFIIPLTSIEGLDGKKHPELKVGDTFTTIDGIDLCWKYVRPQKASSTGGSKVSTKLVDSIVDSQFFPEHTDTGHLLKNVHNLSLEDHITISVKLHGTSCRLGYAKTYRKLSLVDRIAKFFGANVQQYEYSYLVGSRRVLKSKNFQALDGKLHYYPTDVWSSVSREHFEWKLNEGEAIYFEIIGCDNQGSPIQKGYTYNFTSPQPYIYRITNINSQGIEVDLSWDQMEQRAEQLGVPVCPVFFKGSLGEFIAGYGLESESGLPLDEQLSAIFYGRLLEKPSVLDGSVVEEGFCLRVDKFPRPLVLKIKARSFLLKESALQDADVADIEESN